MPVSPEPALSRKNIERIFGSSFVDGNRVTLLWKNPELFSTIFSFIEKAERIVCLQFYIFRNDETGTELAKVLKRKVSEGVSVHILYDHFGSLGTPRSFWNEMKKAGVRVAASRPFKWTRPFHYVHRDHRKLIIIDGREAFIGGLNIANEYRGYHRIRRREGWRDTGVFLEGPVAGFLFDTFRKGWEIWKGIPIDPIGYDRPSGEGLHVLPIFASSARQRRRMRKLLYYSINNSMKSICLTTAYFTPSRRMLQVLEEAVNRGVQVRILLPGKSDISAAHYAGRAFFSKLLKAGVEIYNYQGEILHAKTAVFDSLWSVIGSANLDFRSLRRNDEGNVGIVDPGFGRQMADVFHEDLLKSVQITTGTWCSRPLSEKLKEWFYALFRRRL